jgi:AraC-like DNA-binding protein
MALCFRTENLRFFTKGLADRFRYVQDVFMSPSTLLTVARLRASSATLYRVYDGPGFDLGEWVRLMPSTEAFWIVREGHVTIRMEGEEWTALPGDIMCLGMAPREQFFSRDLRLLSINHVWKDADGRPHFALIKPLLFRASEAVELVRAAERFQRETAVFIGNPGVLMPSVEIDANSYQSIKGWLHLWLASYGRFLDEKKVQSAGCTPVDERLNQARSILDGAPLDAELDYAEVAATAGISRTQLERLFRLQYGTTPHAYFQRRRAEYACHALLGGELSIKVIALNLGFRHLSRFSGWFSAREHHSPRDYRRAMGVQDPK